ncbi:SSH [Lepeophtheirus salmonis]|uniref:PCI domain-containing protein 2 homolog n=1 Tax=Lepeophtheirus salmonis TaxID=72036 RepID=A0A7R8CTY3_LEPSM|nr:SSH [Lepeophtheirus salmonis]CAF2928619.1 SSH [Lepeophtheirus salmonis]
MIQLQIQARLVPTGSSIFLIGIKGVFGQVTHEGIPFIPSSYDETRSVFIVNASQIRHTPVMSEGALKTAALKYTSNSPQYYPPGSSIPSSSNMECCKCYQQEVSSSFIQDKREITNIPSPNTISYSTTTKISTNPEPVLANDRVDSGAINLLLLQALAQAQQTQEKPKVNPLEEKIQGYYNKIISIFNLDLEILRETIDLIRKANTTVLPLIQNVFLPLVNQAQSTSSSLNLENVISNLGLVLTSATYKKVIYSKLEDFKFLNIGPLSFRDSTNFTVPENAIREISNMLTAEFDRSGLGFPIRAFFLGKDAFRTLKSKHSSDAIIEVKHGEIVFDALTPQTELTNNCEFGLTLGNARNRMIIRRNTQFKGGGEITGVPFTEPFRLSLITGGVVDLNLDLNARVHARVGKRLFGKCFGKMRKNLPLRSVSRGKAQIGVQFHASHVRIERRRFQGKPLNLEYDEFLAFTKGQKICLSSNTSDLQIRYGEDTGKRRRGEYSSLASIFIKRKTQSIIEGFGRRTFNINSPKILRRIEKLFAERIGNEIAIPLLLVDENTKIVQSLLVKAITIASLKAELGRDIGELAGQLTTPEVPTYGGGETMMERCLRHGDRLLLSIRLESTYIQRERYFCIVSCSNSSSCHNYCILGIDSVKQDNEEDEEGRRRRRRRGEERPLHWTRISIHTEYRGLISYSNPVSVQGLWTVIQTLHMISNSTMHQSEETNTNYIINSPQSCINEWHAMSDLLVRRPPSPDQIIDSEGEELETLIKSQLREIMKTVDLDNITSKCIRNALEEELKMDLCDYKPFIDKEILVILGQMDPASKILDYVYLGSEWNASNLDELKANGITHILNVTREIDNFFPAVFEYRNIRVYDEESTDLLKFFDETYRFIHKAFSRNGKVLIHCKMGISRSATVTMSYIMKEHEKSLEDTIIKVKERRDIINPNKSFIKQLEVYEGILGAIRNRHNRLFRSKSESSLKKQRRNSLQKANNAIENNRNSRNNRLNRQRSTKKVKALANVFNRTDLLSRPKSWSPNERISSLLLNQEEPPEVDQGEEENGTDESLLHIDEECHCYNDIVTKILVSSPPSSPPPSATVSSYPHNLHCGCNVELELQVPNDDPVVLHGCSSGYIVQNLADLPIRLRQGIDKSGLTSSSLDNAPDIVESSREYNQEELLSVKTIANMFDYKEEMNILTYLKKVEEAWNDYDGVEIARLISFRDSHVFNTKLQLEDPEGVCWSFFVKKDCLEAYRCQSLALTSFNKLLSDTKDDNWPLPVMYTLCLDLRLFAAKADIQLQKKRRETRKTSDEVTKRWGMLNIVNQLFKIYFKVNKLHLCKPLIRAIYQTNLRDLYPKSQQVTFKYYVGRQYMFDNKFGEAEKYLSYAFERCHIDRHMPSMDLLKKYNLLEFREVVLAVKEGNLLRLNAALEANEKIFIKFLIMNTHQIPIASFLKALQMMRVEGIDQEETQCILANLIYEGKIRGYISHVHQKLVVSKQNAFPPLSVAVQ